MAQEYYDIAISFAGEDRRIAEEIFDALTDEGVSVFYDDNEQADLWGKNLYDYLSDIYLNRAKYCVILVSQHYLEKVWTNHERQAAQARAIRQKKEYILPIMLDNSSLIGFETVAFLKWPQQSVNSITEKILYKLGIEPTVTPKPTKRLTHIPGWSPPIMSYLRPDLNSEGTFTLEFEKVNKGIFNFKVSMGAFLIGAISLIIGLVRMFRKENTASDYLLASLFLAVAVAIYLFTRPYLKSFTLNEALSFPYKRGTGLGQYIGGSQFAFSEKDLIYYYVMSMTCVFPGCDGVVRITRRPTENEKYFIARCEKRWESHRYKVFDKGIAIALE